MARVRIYGMKAKFHPNAKRDLRWIKREQAKNKKQEGKKYETGVCR